jgi:AmmeMemoRadiSam system protein A
MTDGADRALLLRVARESIVAHLAKAARPSIPSEGVCARRGAAFVTLHRGSELRGCIGTLDFSETLGAVVGRCAVSAATSDPRFPPATADEVRQLTIEISLLSPFEPIEGPSQIVVGRHGLLIEEGFRRGLLLPQVATEWKMDAESFLGHTCEKAGLARDRWKKGANVLRFEAEVFSESAGP